LSSWTEHFDDSTNKWYIPTTLWWWFHWSLQKNFSFKQEQKRKWKMKKVPDVNESVEELVAIFSFSRKKSTSERSCSICRLASANWRL
jgi:hypothetical protein